MKYWIHVLRLEVTALYALKPVVSRLHRNYGISFVSKPAASKC
jgi:hypothetical protein